MRIAFYGNIANNLYQIVQALREYTDLDANLYLRTNDQFTTQPESDNAELKNNYPDWIIQRPFSGTKNVLMPWQAPLTHELGQSDLSIVCGYGPIYAQFTGKPVCFFTTGSDLTSFPFPATFLPSYKGLRTKIYALLAGYWQRRGIRHVTEIWTQPFFPFMNALNEIGIEAGDPRIVKAYFPLILNTQLFKFDPQARSRSDPNIQRIVANYDFVVFHPSRLMIRDLPMLKRAGQWKRNDLLFRGLKRFLLMLSPTQAARVGLVMPDRLYSDDLALGKRLITDLGLDANVFWAKGPRPEGFLRQELLPYYSVADVVADDFGVGWFGSVVVEAASMSRPVITHINEQVMQQLYPWHPFLLTNTEEGIADYLLNLYSNLEQRQRIGAKGRLWVEMFHDQPTASKIYAQRIQEVIVRMQSTHLL